MSPDDLLNMAEGLATGAVSHRQGRPRRADLNRAISWGLYRIVDSQTLVLQSLRKREPGGNRALDRTR